MFGECPSVIVVTLKEDSLYDLILLSKKYDVNNLTIGRVTEDDMLTINDSISLTKDKISNAYKSSLDDIMNSD